MPQTERQTVTIDCGEGKNAYQIELLVTDLESFYKAESNPEVGGKRGEDRVKALLATEGNSIINVGRLKDGEPNDGPKGEYAIELYAEDGSGKLEVLAHYQNGVQNDGPNGEAASIHFHANGELASVGHYKKDSPHNSVNGDPATMVFNKKGQLEYVAIVTDNEATELQFNGKGAVVRVQQHEYGQLVKKLTKKDDLAEYAAQFKDQIAGYFALADKLQNGISAAPGAATKPALKK